jgi:2-polyprenyl-3-methyl-5-hydroxy-6-metoxy-1,4-benzoquinol methylase
MTNETEAKVEERIDIYDHTKFSDEMIKRHVDRYKWARDKIIDRFYRAGRVVDFACGTGYGSAILLQASHTVLGIDRDDVALDKARKRHGGSLLTFMFTNAGIVGKWPADAVVSIETIEHLEKPDIFLKDAFQAIDDNGLLVLSTPEAHPDRVVTNPYHLREYTKPEIQEAIEKAGFVDVKFDNWLDGFICLTARKP